MKHLLFTVALVASCLCAFAAPQTIPATLQTATVYQSGAELIHTATFALQAGENTIRIEGLTPRIVNNSLQVMLTNGVVISSFEYSIDYLSSGKYNTQAQALRDSLRIYTDRLTAKKSEIEVTTTMLALLQKGVEGNFAATKQAPTTDAIDKNLTYYQRQSLALHQQLAEQNKQAQDLQTRITAIDKQLQTDEGLQAKQAGVLTLQLNAPKAVKNARAQVKYFTRSASWTPAYDINVTDIAAPLSLLSKASVQQHTGVDWTDVRLTLSTYAPSTNNVAPEFTTWYLRQASPRVGSTAKRNMNYVLQADVEVPMEMEMETATMADYITQEEQALSVSYTIDMPYTVLGNGKAQIIPLNEKQVSNVAYEYFVAPKLSETAYLLAKISDWEKLQLLSGMAGITYAGTYYGQTYLNTINTDQALRLTLGTDPQIAVKREKINDYSAERILGSSKTTTQAYRITLRNNKNRPVTIRLQEQYPVSTNKDITVELTDKTTAWTENDAEKGILTYLISLAAGETQEIVVGYSVKAPKDWRLNL